MTFKETQKTQTKILDFLTTLNITEIKDFSIRQIDSEVNGTSYVVKLIFPFNDFSNIETLFIEEFNVLVYANRETTTKEEEINFEIQDVEIETDNIVVSIFFNNLD